MSVSPALAQLPSDAKQGLMGSLQQHPEAGSGGHKAPANRGSYKPGQIVPAKFCAPSLLSLEVGMFVCGHPHLCQMQLTGLTLYVSMLSRSDSWIRSSLKCSEGMYDWLVQRSPSQGLSGKAFQTQKPGSFIESMSGPTPAPHSPIITCLESTGEPLTI